VRPMGSCNRTQRPWRRNDRACSLNTRSPTASMWSRPGISSASPNGRSSASADAEPASVSSEPTATRTGARMWTTPARGRVGCEHAPSSPSQRGDPAWLHPVHRRSRCKAVHKDDRLALPLIKKSDLDAVVPEFSHEERGSAFVRSDQKVVEPEAATDYGYRSF